jgi:hypothetical protein
LRKSAVAFLLALVLTSLLVTSAYASTVSIQANLNSSSQELNVTFEFAMDNATYNILKNNSSLLNATSVPRTIQTNYAKEGHTGLTYSNAQIFHNDKNSSIISTFQLSGQGVISSTINRATGIESFQLSTMWRKFALNTTDLFFNFTQDLGTSLTQWMNTTANGIPSFSFSNSTEGVSCTFELPSSATNVARVGETISFDVPYQVPFGDKLIDSPILVLIVLAVVGLIIFVYRKTR